MSGALTVFSQNSVPVPRDSPELKGNQTAPEEVYKVGEVRGNIKRKAIYLPKPVFSREALEAGADGTVKVEVVLDAEGNVVAAKAISGHPLLYPSAEETARKTKFRRADTTDPNATETGVLTYNFAIAKASWLKIGYDLAIIQKIPTLRPFNAPRIARAFQPEWLDEMKMLDQLAEMRRIEIESNGDDRPVFVRKTNPNSNGAPQSSISAEVRLPVRNPPTGERISLSQNLTAALQSRLATDESGLWKFNAGANLAKAFEDFRRPDGDRSAAQNLRQSTDTAPSDISPETLTELKKLARLFEAARPTAEAWEQISKSMGIVFREK